MLRRRSLPTFLAMPSAHTADGIIYFAQYHPGVRLLCPAKINLPLRVAKVGADGFHPLLSWFCTTSLCDVLTLEPTTAFTFTLKCSDASLPVDERNLVVRAAKRMGLAADAYLEKYIPLGAGLGGGSSDAGRLLLAARSGLDPGLAEKIASNLGSDIPFFLHGGSAICTGRGEIVRPIAPPLARYALLVLPDLHISTPAVYGKFDEMRLGSELIDEDWSMWTMLPAEQLLPRLINGLEAPAFALEPSLAKIRAETEQQLGRTVRMSGSGSSLFTLFDDESTAMQSAKMVSLRTVVVELAPAISDDLTANPPTVPRFSPAGRSASHSWSSERIR